MEEYRKPFEYAPRGRVFRIYDADGKALSDIFFDKEKARKKVYELNGWKYKPRNEAVTSPTKG